MLTTTLGQLLVNEALPEDLQDQGRVLDKKGLRDLMRTVAEKHPEDYAAISHKLLNVGQSAATTGNFSFSLKDFQSTPSKKQAIDRLRLKAQILIDHPTMNAKQREEALVKALGGELDTLVPSVLDEAHKSGNQLAAVVKAGTKGNPSQFNTTVGAPLLYLDHKDKAVPIPVFHSVAEGLDPAEYWASTYGTRKGLMSVKMSVAEAGYFGKKLGLAANRLVVTEHDCGTTNGIRADGADKENVGTVLLQDAGGLKAGTVIKPEHLSKLKGTTITVRSPLTCQAHDGLCAKCSGVRERGVLPELGENVGITASSALGERLSQIMLSCLAEGTLVRMADMSVKPIEQIIVGDTVLGVSVTGELRPVKVTRTFDHGIQPCSEYTYKLPATHGQYRTLVCTSEHKVLARQFYSGTGGTVDRTVVRKIGSLSKCSWLAMSSTFCDSGYEYEPRAALLGTLLGDGCFTESVNGVFLSCADETQIGWLNDYVSQWGLVFTRLKYHNGIYYRLSEQRRRIKKRDSATGRIMGGQNPVKRWLVDLDLYGKKAHEKQLPACVYTWNNRAVAELIAGLIVTDGSVFTSANGHSGISYCSTSRQLVDQVALLLSTRFGIHVGSVSCSTTGRVRPLYSFCISKYEDIVRFSDCVTLFGRKRNLLTGLVGTYTVSRSFNSRVMKFVGKEEAGPQHVYDIEVDHPDHLFLLENGMIVSNSKHTSGAASAKKSYDYEDIERLFEMPKTSVEFAPVATDDGIVKSIEKAPAGGCDIKIGDQTYWTHDQDLVHVKPGQHVEAGDILAKGIPNPALLAKHRGIGDARRMFVDNVREVTGNNVSRRNAEVLARAMISHVQVNELHGPHGAMIGDITRYDNLVRDWEPRHDSRTLLPSQTKGQYLEAPVMHYTVGTKITDRMIKDLHANNIKNITVHKDPPGFEPDVQRMFAHSQLDPDWMTRMSGYHLGSSLPDAVHRGMTSEEHSTSFVPALAKGVDFGTNVKETGKY